MRLIFDQMTLMFALKTAERSVMGNQKTVVRNVMFAQKSVTDQKVSE